MAHTEYISFMCPVNQSNLPGWCTDIEAHLNKYVMTRRVRDEHACLLCAPCDGENGDSVPTREHNEKILMEVRKRPQPGD